MNPEQVILTKAGGQRYGVTLIENEVPVVDPGRTSTSTIRKVGTDGRYTEVG